MVIPISSPIIFRFLQLLALPRLGNKAFAAKNYDEAISYYTQAIKRDPSNHVFFSNRSASYGGLEDWDKAAEDAKECIRLDPTFIKGYYRLANAQMEQQEYDKAAATIRQGLGAEPNNPQLSKLMRSVKKLKKASSSGRQQASASQLMNQQHNIPNLDESAARELQDLQVQFSQTTRERNTLQANVNMVQREVKLTEATKAELEPLPDDQKCYRSIGKIFLRSNKGDVMDYLNTQIDDKKKIENDMAQKMDYLERRLKSQQQNMEEILSTNE